MRFYFATSDFGDQTFIDDWVSHHFLRLTPYVERRKMSDDFINDGLNSYGKYGHGPRYKVPDLLVILLLGEDHI